MRRQTCTTRLQVIDLAFPASSPSSGRHTVARRHRCRLPDAPQLIACVPPRPTYPKNFPAKIRFVPGSGRNCTKDVLWVQSLWRMTREWVPWSITAAHRGSS